MTVVQVETAVDLTTIECCSCGMTFGVPVLWERSKRRHGDGFVCPNGHSLTFGEGENEKLRKKAERARKQAEAERDARYAEQRRREMAERRASAFKGQATRLRNKAKDGVCPECDTKFPDLARHMETQHPHFSGDVEDPDA